MSTNITKNNTRKSMVEIVKSIRQNSEVEILKIDGIECGIMGYANEADKQAGISVIQEIVDNSDKRGCALAMEVMQTMMVAGWQNEAGVPADATPEAVNVNGKDMNILYDKKAIYNSDCTKEIANCTDLPDMPKEAIKAVLIERAKNARG
jgi:hypothetical protein